MIVKTRYRDIDESELEHPISARFNWANTRGREILIEVPAANHTTESTVNGRCGGPTFRRVDKEGNYLFNKSTQRYISVCPHLAEIGD